MQKSDKIYLLGQKIALIQPERGFRPGLDSVMLAAACPARDGDKILDLGCGVGGASFCVLYRIKKAHLTGIDIQADHIELAEENARMNDMDGRAEFHHSDIRDFKGRGFDYVICNPPFMEGGAGTPSSDQSKSAAHMHGETALKDWIDAAAKALRQGGGLTMIHRADHMQAVIHYMQGRFGAVEIIPLWPKKNTPAKRVIIRAVKDRKGGSILHPGIILHKDSGDYTAESQKILRGASPLL